MTTTLKLQERRTVTRTSDGDQIYRIELECTDEGPLNDKGIFVFQIFNTRNPLGDIFQRVAAVVDLEDYVDDRNEAVSAGDEYWRESTHVLEYTDVDVANNAVRTIHDRVNSLVQDYQTYETSFLLDPAGVTSFPTADETIVNERKADYDAALATFNTTTDAVTTAADELADAQSAFTVATDARKEWQEQKDAVCGGNTSGEGNRYGLNNYILEVAEGFIGMYDNDGGIGSYVSSVYTILQSLDTFFTTFDVVQLGGGSVMRRLEVTPGTNPTITDIGKTVTGAPSGATGALVAYDASNHYWWVGGVSGTFTTSDTVSIGGGTGAGSVDEVLYAPDGPLDAAGDLLRTAHGNLQSMFDNQATPIESIAQAAINAGNQDSGPSVCTDTTTITSEKNADVVTAEQDLKDKQAAYATAQGAAQAAYDATVAAYDSVKEVCPDWSPATPLPAQP